MRYPFFLRDAATPAAGHRASRPYGDAVHRINAFLILAAALALFLPAPSPASATQRILAFGDSLTAGYGLPEADTFPVRLEAALRAAGIDAEIINAGVSGDTTTAALNRLDWLLRGSFDLVIVELGANDGLRGIDPAVTRANLDAIVARILASDARVLLAGMRAPPNLGRDYGAAFDSIFPAVARKHDVAYYPFFLDGVVAEPDLNQGDGMHPNAKGVAIIVERMLPFVIEASGKDAP